jgi:hypothetical protein
MDHATPSFDLEAALFGDPIETFPAQIVLRGDVWSVRTDGQMLVGHRLPGDTPTPTPDETKSATAVSLLDPTHAPTRIDGATFRAFVAGRVSRCLRCRGRRRVRCEDCWGTKEWRHRCGECDHEHTVRCHCETGSTRCLECSSLRVDTANMALVGGMSFDARKLARILAAAPADQVLYLGIASDSLRIVGEGWAAALMHCTSEEDERVGMPVFELAGSA